MSTNPANHTSTAATTDDDPPAGTRERGRLYRRLHANPALSLTTKIVVTVVEVLVMGTGIVMMVTPGPGIVGIVLGLAILASEYAWADRWLVKAREGARGEGQGRADGPQGRRRRLLLAGLVLLVVVGAVAAYVTAYDWPVLAVDAWNWLQGVAGWMPELPGM